MRTYTKINTMFERDERGLIIPGKWATPEIAYLADTRWYFTEKVDGTNTRVAIEDIIPYPDQLAENLRPDHVTYGGRTDDAMISTHILRALDERFRSPQGVVNLSAVFPGGGAILFGEGYGNKVDKQGARAYKDGADFVLFDVLVQSREGPLWLTRSNVEDVAAKLGLEVVPIVGQGTLWDAIDLVRSEFPSYWGAFPAEGIVARPVVDLLTRRGERVMTKLKVQDFRRLEAQAAKEAQ